MTAAAFDALLNRMYNRVGLERLPAHLHETYDIDISATEQLDVGVLRIDRGGAPPWVARVFAADRPASATEADAAVLRYVAEHDFPAERLAAEDPISGLGGQQVLVTEFVPRADDRVKPPLPEVYRLIGALLGRLHALPLPTGAAARPAGALHHFAEGTRVDELRAAASWLDQIAERVAAENRKHVDRLRTALAEADGGEGLPTALIHPDPVVKNMVRTAEGFAYVDWSGAGVGARVASLEFALGSKASAPDVARGYAEHVELTDEEWERMAAVRAVRGLVGLCFRLGFAPDQAPKLPARISAIRRDAEHVVAAARR